LKRLCLILKVIWIWTKENNSFINGKENMSKINGISSYLNYTDNDKMESKIYTINNPENVFYGRSFFGKECTISEEKRIWDYGTIGRSYPFIDCGELSDEEKIQEVLRRVSNE